VDVANAEEQATDDAVAMAQATTPEEAASAVITDEAAARTDSEEPLANAQSAVPAQIAADEQTHAVQPSMDLSADLEKKLDAAALTLAVTDPAKLQAAREAAAQEPAPARPKRVRKSLPQPPAEPLVQVETP